MTARAFMVVGWLLAVGPAPAGEAPRSQPENLSAPDFLHAYWNFPKDSDAKYKGKQVEVTGLIDSVHPIEAGDRSVLDLETRERSYYVRCVLKLDAVGRARRLERGQLVAVRGTGNGAPKDRPELIDCWVSWQGDLPGSPPADADKRAAIAGRSATICRVARFHREVIERKVPLGKAPHVKEALAGADREEARARADLKKLGADPLPCTHPLVFIVARCERDVLLAGSVVDVDSVLPPTPPGPPPSKEEREAGSECATKEVRDAVAQARFGQERQEQAREEPEQTSSGCPDAR